MSEQLAELSKMGGSPKSIKDLIRQEALFGDYATVYTFTPSQSRTTLNEGRIAVDTVNKIVYLYADCTLIVNLTQNNRSATLKASSLMPATLMPADGAGGRVSTFEIVNDTTYTVRRTLYIRDSAGGTFIAKDNDVAWSSGERHIVYAMWSYL